MAGSGARTRRAARASAKAESAEHGRRLVRSRTRGRAGGIVGTFLACEHRVRAAGPAGGPKLKYVQREWRTQNAAPRGAGLGPVRVPVALPGRERRICSRIPHCGVRVPARVAGVALFALALAGGLRAQTADSAAASPFRPLDLPAANEVRTGSGRPGQDYWQQRADYRIQATLDPAHARAARARDDSLHQPLPDRAALPLALRRAEHLRAGKRHRAARSAAAGLPRLDLRFLLQGLRTAV